MFLSTKINKKILKELINYRTKIIQEPGSTPVIHIQQLHIKNKETEYDEYTTLNR